MSIPFDRVQHWMFEAALPFWAENGVDREHGGFREELTLDGRPTDVAFKRTRVVCRQIYVFSHAALLGWERGRALSEMGCAYLIEKAWAGPEKGWARRLTRTGEALDPTPDLYDLAFVLFALAWRYRVAKDNDVLAHAHRTLAFIQAHMAAGEGYVPYLPDDGARLQNPHMHLLEACLAAFEATRDEVFLDEAKRLVALFRARLFDGRTLGEYFTADWRRAPAPEGRQVEPGHQFEWAWILAKFQRLAGADLTREAAALADFAEAHGVDAQTQATFNLVRDDGAALDKGSRAWPNTERLKGHLALFELIGRDPRAAAAGSAKVLLDRYLNVTPRGSWIDHFDAAGKALSAAAPASTLYHVFLAFAELMRLRPALERI